MDPRALDAHITGRWGEDQFTTLRPIGDDVADWLRNYPKQPFTANMLIERTNLSPSTVWRVLRRLMNERLIRQTRVLGLNNRMTGMYQWIGPAEGEA